MNRSTIDWVVSREPAAPPALAVHVSAALGALDALGADEASERSRIVAECLDAAEATLARVLRGATTTRAAALDLLTADALVTYAFEAASDAPDDLPAAARAAMRRLSRLASDDAVAS